MVQYAHRCKTPDIYGVLSPVSCHQRTCALRAPTAFSARINGIRAENAVTVNSRDLVGFYPRSSIVHGWLLHPRTIDDPRGRLLVRATSQPPRKGDALALTKPETFAARHAVPRATPALLGQRSGCDRAPSSQRTPPRPHPKGWKARSACCRSWQAWRRRRCRARQP